MPDKRVNLDTVFFEAENDIYISTDSYGFGVIDGILTLLGYADQSTSSRNGIVRSSLDGIGPIESMVEPTNCIGINMLYVKVLIGYDHILQMNGPSVICSEMAVQLLSPLLEFVIVVFPANFAECSNIVIESL